VTTPRTGDVDTMNARYAAYTALYPALREMAKNVR
jgi:hypothetical protein